MSAIVTSPLPQLNRQRRPREGLGGGAEQEGSEKPQHVSLSVPLQPACTQLYAPVLPLLLLQSQRAFIIP